MNLQSLIRTFLLSDKSCTLYSESARVGCVARGSSNKVQPEATMCVNICVPVQVVYDPFCGRVGSHLTLPYLTHTRMDE